MKNAIFIILLSILSFSSEIQKNTTPTVINNTNVSDEFYDEFSEQADTEVFDPLSGYNRVMTKFNDKIYIYALNPIATGYSNVLPENLRIAIANFLNNLMFPVRFTNNLLQLKFQNSAEELERFVINTIWGLGGFMDPADTELNIKEHSEDFGQTLGFYGAGEGFHIVLPFLGPSSLRDVVGMVPDSYISAVSTTGSSDIKYKIPNTTTEQIAIKGTEVINKTSLRLGQYENMKKDALDLYPFLRDIYSQARKKQIEE